jgi:hypothetical protein
MSVVCESQMRAAPGVPGSSPEYLDDRVAMGHASTLATDATPAVNMTFELAVSTAARKEENLYGYVATRG